MEGRLTLQVLLSAAVLVGGEFLSWPIAFFAVALTAERVGFSGVGGADLF